MTPQTFAALQQQLDKMIDGRKTRWMAAGSSEISLVDEKFAASLEVNKQVDQFCGQSGISDSDQIYRLDRYASDKVQEYFGWLIASQNSADAQ